MPVNNNKSFHASNPASKPCLFSVDERVRRQQWGMKSVKTKKKVGEHNWQREAGRDVVSERR